MLRGYKAIAENVNEFSMLFIVEETVEVLKHDIFGR